MGSTLVDGDPQRLGEYWLAARIGAGGQGIVYEAYDPAGVRVAVKVLHGDPANQAELRGRMAKEAVATQRVASFCTARVLGVHLEGSRPYIVSEYVEGPSLRKAGRVFRGDDLHRLATAIATALTAIHDAGVVHRDLKPDNVLLGPDGPRVIDFGVARTLEMSLTASGVVAGTPNYMAPEVFSGQRAGPAADVFAWGAVILYAATGEDPFTAGALGAVMHRVLSHEPDLAVLPDSLRHLVGAALAKEPADRPTARELLLGLVNGDGVLDTPRLLALGAGDGRRIGIAAADGERVGVAADDPALGVIAEDAYAALSPADKELVPELFLRLVTVTAKDELALRELRRSELPDGIERVLDAFTYLVSKGDPVRLLRPALPLAWPRLRAWIATNRDGLVVHRQIWTAAERWQEHGRRDADLFHGSSLDDALRWAAAERRNITLTPGERDFLSAAAALARRRSRRTRFLSLGLAVLLALALIAGGLAVLQSVRLAEQRDTAESARLAGLADTVRGADPVLGMLLSATAGRLSPTAEARSSLFASVADQGGAAFRDPDTGPDVVRALTADGRSLISVSPDEVRVWDVSSGRRTGGFTGLGLTATPLRQAAVSEDGRLLAVGDSKSVRLWDLAGGKPLGLHMPASDMGDLELSFSGGLLIIDWGQGKTVYNPRTGKTTMLPTLARAAIHPGGDYAVAGNQRWALPSGKEQPGFPGICSGCLPFSAFSRDGRMLAVGGNTDLIVFDTRSRKEITTISDWESMAVPVFSPDGKVLAGFGSTIRLYRLNADEPLMLERDMVASVSAVAFGPTGLRYLSEDTVVTLRPYFTGEDVLDEVQFSADGRLLATHTLDSTKITLNGRDFEAGAFQSYDADLSFSRDGGRLAIKRSDDVTVWDTATRRELAKIPIPDGSDGALLAPAGLWTAGEKTFTLWQVPGGRRLKQVTRPRLLGWTVAPDGRLIGLDASLLRLVDLESGRAFGPRLLFSGTAEEVWFSADLKLVAANFAGKVGIWDTSTGAQVGDWLRAGQAAWTAAFSADDRLFAFASQQKSLTVWDVRLSRRIGPEIQLPDDARSIAFSADSTELRAMGRAGRLTRLPMAMEPLMKAVCVRAGRSLTEAEWNRYLPDQPFRKVC
ncbi:WD40 repeat domain-containing serine/threonine protein kinase [Nonomuraea aurantiaca]|uniref:WD40 repeat domain-containing serine/threonine protein kinase n=1 Tax=Nonomuraea aurantiaca TaxID=2878562 RepID=UPI001CD91B2E|nr:WD40 repeat domain-containing serine/threonine protein kinase [Nonomuraea aurantiaca]MCA2221218.1 WD40 repeat domain-containing serine/threonine protein kinase [Nonomuraea aurantiaca]